MSRGTLLNTISKGKVLVSDGGWGTALQNIGLPTSDCPEEWNDSHPNEVYQVAKRYIQSGSDLVETNSFGANRIKLALYGLEDKVESFNIAAAQLSRKAAGSKNWVLGSIGPTGKMLLMGDVTKEQLYDIYKEQALALQKGGVDAICIETMSDIDEATIAVRAAKENCSCEVIATFTFEKTISGDYRSMMGVNPVSASKAMICAGADIIGTNCGNGFKGMIEVVKEIRSQFKTPILVHANAGIPILHKGKTIYPDSAQDMASLAPLLVDAGANIIGGCCGTCFEHISAIKAALK